MAENIMAIEEEQNEAMKAEYEVEYEKNQFELKSPYEKAKEESPLVIAGNIDNAGGVYRVLRLFPSSRHT
jgi:hypothetical protein